MSAPSFDVAGTLPHGLTALDASAGTGKTYALAALAVRYVAERGVPASALCIVTFTDAATAELRGRVPETVHHGGEHLVGRVVVRESVGVGEEVALERGGVGRKVGDQGGLGALGGEEGVAGAETCLLGCPRNVEDVVALRHGETHGIDVAAQDAGVDLGGRGGMVEEVFAGLQAATLQLP